MPPSLKAAKDAVLPAPLVVVDLREDAEQAERVRDLVRSAGSDGSGAVVVEHDGSKVVVLGRDPRSDPPRRVGMVGQRNNFHLAMVLAALSGLGRGGGR
jgi:hypothetical protein